MFCLAGVFALEGCDPPPNPKIAVTVASWGYGAERVDVAQDVSKLCQDKQSCSFAATGDAFGGKPDPSPGNRKGLIVVWKCMGAAGEAEHKYQFAEGKAANLSCP